MNKPLRIPLPLTLVSIGKLCLVPVIIKALQSGQHLNAAYGMAAIVAISFFGRFRVNFKAKVFSSVIDGFAFIPVLALLGRMEIAGSERFPALMVLGSLFIVLKELFSMWHSIAFLRGSRDYFAPVSMRRVNEVALVTVAALYTIKRYPFAGPTVVLNLSHLADLAMILVLMVAIADTAGFIWNYFKKRRGIKDMNLATKITLVRLLMSPAFLVIYFYDRNPNFADNSLMFQIIAIVFGIAFVVSDGLDGYFARKRNEVTKFGKYLDPFSDKICTTTIFLCFVASNYVPVWMVALIYYREASISVIRTRAAAENVVVSARRSGKWKTGLQGTAILTILLLATTLSTLAHSSFPSLYPEIYASLLVVWSYVPFTLMALVTAVTVVSGIDYILACRFILDKYFK
ncbi:MAG: CDP-diacylglycerol--glycerol-3-phosphate 3-phosphatidyltransferase [Candidatus Raymondbacteria bacterium RifOxyC12_full_50_8]|nr:MAG: CDP-diacylglycerol--glycerol-3-phosphate 3-phosphatidyltransferase [Candidatus Raymondbacteria bacterium RifOxyC12_full_50_8]